MDTNEKLLSAMFNIGRLIKEEIHASNCLEDFTHTEIEILKFLQGKENTTMKSIADYLHIKPSSTTSVIDSLVKKGSIKRAAKSGDRRVVYIELTSRGLKSLQKKYKSIHKTIEKIFGGLSDKNKKTLIKIFEKIHAENT
jgi:MarR family 2-MHQ and catechol resistance regulon transcriptional repressor